MEPIVDAVVYVITPESNALGEWTGVLSAVAAISSVFIACIALWYSRKQVHMHEFHNRLMATPHLSGWTHLDNKEGTFLFTLENTGIGPAVIKKIKLKVDGELIEGQGSDLIDAAIDKVILSSHDRATEMFNENEFISAGRLLNIFHASKLSVPPEEVEKILKQRVRLLIQYESIFGDKYSYDSSIN